MTEKELIRQSMASNLKLPTDLMADEAIEKKPGQVLVSWQGAGVCGTRADGRCSRIFIHKQFAQARGFVITAADITCITAAK